MPSYVQKPLPRPFIFLGPFAVFDHIPEGHSPWIFESAGEADAIRASDLKRYVGQPKIVTLKIQGGPSGYYLAIDYRGRRYLYTESASFIPASLVIENFKKRGR